MATDASEAGAVANAAPDDGSPVKGTDAALLAKARERYDRAMEMDDENREHALQCLKFRNLEQWDPEVKNMREKDPEGARPCLVVDKTNQYINQVINDYRQNRPAIKVRPLDGKGDPEVAEVFQGIVRHIEDKSSADVAYENAYENAVDGGYGYFRLTTEYSDPMSVDEQDIRIVPVKNRFTVLLDPERQYPHRPPKWGFVMEKMQRKDFEEMYPNADPMDYETDGKIYNNWAFKDFVIVAEYFYIESSRKTICLCMDGSVQDKAKLPAGAQIVQRDGKDVERITTIETVKWCKLTAADVLERKDWAGAYIPILEVSGTELDIEGKSVKSGLLKGAMTPQTIHNYAASSFVENVMLAPRASWVAAEGQIEGYEELYRTANRRSISVLPYKPVVAEGNIPVPPPQRVAPPGLSAGWLQAMQNSEHDIQASMGMYANTTLGQGDANSGKQELLQQRRGDTATFHYADNAARAIRFAGTMLIDLIPKIYDTRRVVRILGEDGEADQAEIDPNQQSAVRKVQDEQGAIKKIYNLTVGKYDVTVTVGASFATKRMEAVEWLTQIVQAQPDLIHVAGDILFRNMDAPGSEELADRFKALLPAPIKALEDDGEGPQVQTPRGPVSVGEAGQIIAQLEQSSAQAQQLLQSKEMRAKEAEAQRVAVDAGKLDLERHKEAAEQTTKIHEGERADRELELRAAEVEISRFSAETARIAVESKAGIDKVAADTALVQATSELSGAQEIIERVVGGNIAALGTHMAHAMQPVVEALMHSATIHATPRVARRPDGSIIATSGLEQQAEQQQAVQ